jgi:hypothetical protein
VSRIFLSSIISPGGGGFSIASGLLDEKVFSVRGFIGELVEVDGAKLVGVFFIFFAFGLLLF